MQLSLGQTYADKYRITRLLGEGAMGAVYEAENVRIHRKVAIKILHPQIAQKADTLRRFEREAQAAGRIGSQHIIEVLDLGELGDGSRFMVMEFLEGTTLDQRIRSRGRLKPEEASPIVGQILDGLGAAHQAGIIHRDLKPANIFLATKAAGDFVKILDFGVSKFNVLNEEMSMTSTGAVLGTPYYMSPEQAKGSRQVDPRSDLYAVGVILYECITGQVPFSAETFNELIFRIVLESPPPVESFVPNLDPGFTAIIHKAMAREADARFQTAAEFRASLQQWSERAAAGPVMPPPGGGNLAAGGTMMMDHAPPQPNLGAGHTVAMDGRPQPAGAPPWAPSAPHSPMTSPFPAVPDNFGQQPMPPGVPQQPVQMQNQPYGNAPQAFPQDDAPYSVPKRGNGAIAFVGGLLAVLVIGGATVGIIKWKTERNAAAATAASAALSATAPVATTAAPPPTTAAPPVVPPPTTPTATEPVAVNPPPVVPPPVTPGTGRGTPGLKPSGKAAAGPVSTGTAKSTGKRTVTGEL